jgi:hypothetical protein
MLSTGKAVDTCNAALLESPQTAQIYIEQHIINNQAIAGAAGPLHSQTQGLSGTLICSTIQGEVEVAPLTLRAEVLEVV